MIAMKLSKKLLQMALIATITDKGINLESFADRINSARTDDVSFYVNGNNVSVSYRYNEMPVEKQRLEIEWFLNGRIFTISER